MEDAPHPEIIIVRRRGGHEEEHHGGAWKIAFADFMTAMMAFFLVLWIINATDKDTKTIIARYFNPVKLEESSRTPKSIHGDGSATPAVDASDGTQTAKSKQSGPVGAAKTPDDPPPPTATSGLDKPGGNPPGAAANLGDPAAPKANMTEGVLFADPYRSLDSIAGPTSPNVLAIMQRDMANGRAGERRPPRSVPFGGAPGGPRNQRDRVAEAAGRRCRAVAAERRRCADACADPRRTDAACRRRQRGQAGAGRRVEADSGRRRSTAEDIGTADRAAGGGAAGPGR